MRFFPYIPKISFLGYLLSLESQLILLGCMLQTSVPSILPGLAIARIWSSVTLGEGAVGVVSHKDSDKAWRPPYKLPQVPALPQSNAQLSLAADCLFLMSSLYLVAFNKAIWQSSFYFMAWLPRLTNAIIRCVLLQSLARMKFCCCFLFKFSILVWQKQML